MTDEQPKHAKYGPSWADGWMVCTAAGPLIERLLQQGELKESDLPDERRDKITEEELLEQNIDGYWDSVLAKGDDTTVYAAEGTVMHQVRETVLNFPDLSPMDFVGDTMEADGFKFVISEDMADKLVPGIDWIRQHTITPFTEGRVDLGFLMPDQFGTCDAYWLVEVHATAAQRKKLFETSREARADGAWYDLYISDLKFGAGEAVDAIGNRQLRLYALGAWHKLGRPNIRKVILNIDQPRAGGMKFDEFTFNELMAFSDEVRRVWHKISTGNVEFVPTKKGCRWCPVKDLPRGCAAYNMWMLWMLGKAVMDPSVDPQFQDPAQMSRAMRYYIVKNAPLIRSWLSKMADASLASAMAGDPDPGSKAILGSQGNRRFTDPEAAEQIIVGALGDMAYKKTLIGFGEIDSLMKPGKQKMGFPDEWEKLQELIDRPPHRVKLVSADHPATEYQAVSDDDFDDLV